MNDASILRWAVRFACLAFFGFVGLAVSGSQHAFVCLALFALSVPLSMFVLERGAYDVRSSLVLLLIFCNLYFAGRPSFAERHWGWYYAFGWLTYDFFLFGLCTGLLVLRPRMSTPSARACAPRFDGRRRRRRLLAGAGLTLVAYVLLIRHILSAAGAEGSFMELVFQSLATRLAVADLGLSSQLQLSYVLSTLGLACAFVLWHLRRRVWLPLWIVAIGYASLTLGSRGGIVIPLLQILLAVSLLARRPLRMAFVVLVPVVVAVNIFSTWYLAARTGADAVDDAYSIFDRFDAYGNWLEALAERGPIYAPGTSIPNAVLQFVPRSLYPAKPYYFSSEMTRVYVPSAFDLGINLDFGGIAESVYNFGLLGPPLFGLFLGWITLKIERIRRDAMARHSPMTAFIYTQGALLPASFFFVGWINSSLIFVVIGFGISVAVLRALDPESRPVRRPARSTPDAAALSI